MKKLIDIFQQIDNILFELNQIIYKEYINLLNSKTDLKKLSYIVEKKHCLLNKLIYIKQKQVALEKSYNIRAPYVNYNELNYYSNKIINKCTFLNQTNLKNKKLTKQKFYLNQNFLNLYKSYKNNDIYDIDRN